jgi:hypothetical protein
MIYSLQPKVTKLIPNLLSEGMIQLDLVEEVPVFSASSQMLQRIAEL